MVDMGTTYLYGTSGGSVNREDVMNAIVNSDPFDTPLLNMAPKVPVNHTTVEWLEHSLDSTSGVTAGRPEGQAFTQDDITAPSRKNNRTQIFAQHVVVSDTQQVVSTCHELPLRKAERRRFLQQQAVGDLANLAPCQSLFQRTEQRQIEDLQQALINALLPFALRRAQLSRLLRLGLDRPGQDRLAFLEQSRHQLFPENIGSARRSRLAFSAGGTPHISRCRSTIVLATGDDGSNSSSGIPPSMLESTFLYWFGRATSRSRASVRWISSSVTVERFRYGFHGEGPSPWPTRGAGQASGDAGRGNRRWEQGCRSGPCPSP